MLQVSAKTDYGLLFMVALAEQADRHPRSLRQIAEERGLPYRFLAQIATPLKDHGLLMAKEGAQGGYHLSRRASKITVGEILRSLEGRVELVRCHEHGAGVCPSRDLCTLSSFWRRVGDRLSTTLESMTLADLVHETRAS